MKIAIPNRREYDWRLDSHLSWQFALRCMALACGSRRFETVAELYFVEQQGQIP